MIPTQTATVVFTDLVGSTELAVRLGHDAFEELRRSHFESLRLAASIHHGSEIKSTGDGLVFAFSSAAEAVASMIRMQQAVHAARREVAEHNVRIGASCGETNRDGNDIFGISVVEAARLCATASPGQILVSELVVGLIRGLSFKFAPAGEFTLKGLPDQVAAFAFEWAPRGESDDLIPLPPKIGPAPCFGLYGRAHEQALVAQSWAAAKQGQRRVSLLSGEPGIGKTRLAIEAGRIADSENGIVLLGTCDEDIRPPYRPFVEALRHYLVNAPEEVLLQHTSEHHGDLLRIVPALAERVPNVPKPHTADAETERYLLFEAVTGLLSAASARRPIILILDDLQWAGAPELLLIKHIVRSTMPLRLLILGTYRDTELPQTHPLTALLADLRSETGIERIAMTGLNENGVVDFVTAAVGRELDEAQLAVARTISRDTEGSPLFVGEILRHLAESISNFWQTAAKCESIENFGIPTGVKEAIGRRLSRFSADTSKILTAASVIGREFDLELLNQVAEMPEPTILDAVDDARTAALIALAASETDTYSFTHVLVRDALYNELNPDRRARMHARVGAALEQLTAGRPAQRIDELARHWLAAGRFGDSTKAIGYARQAGDQSLASLAFEQASKYYQQALSVLAPHRDQESEPLRCDLLISLADAQRRASNPSYRQTVGQAIEIARSLGDTKRFALAALCSARPEHPFANANVIDEPLLALYEEAIATLEDEDENVLQAKLFAHLAGEMLYTPQRDRRQELGRKAVSIARKCGDQAVLAQALHIYASAINDPTTLSERLSLTAEQVALADKLVSFEIRWSAAYQRMGALLESGDIEGTRQMLAKMKEIASKLRQPFFIWATDHALAMISVMSGASDAEEKVLAAFQVGTAASQPDAKQAMLSQLSCVRRDQGRHGELIEPLRETAKLLPHLPVWSIVLAGLYCETDQLEKARAQIDKLATCDFKISLDWTWSSSIFSLAQTCADLADRKIAALYYPQLKPVAGQVGVTGIGLVCYGSLAFPCGQFAACIGRWGEAEQYFNQALAMNERIGARPYVVRTRRTYANMLLDRNAPGDRTRAAKLIEQGRFEADQLGMRREIVRLDRLRSRPDLPQTKPSTSTSVSHSMTS